MVADDLAPSVARSSAAMVLTISDQQFLSCHDEEFQLLVWAQCLKMFFLQNISTHKGLNSPPVAHISIPLSMSSILTPQCQIFWPLSLSQDRDVHLIWQFLTVPPEQLTRGTTRCCEGGCPRNGNRWINRYHAWHILTSVSNVVLPHTKQVYSMWIFQPGIPKA